METKDTQNALHEIHGQTSLADATGRLEETCKNCELLTPISCIAGCKTWRMKNQFRKLHEKTKDPDFMIKLLNTLKNGRRLQLLEMLSKERYSIVRLQQELQKLGFNHGQQTIVEEYINPLMDVALIEENNNLYQATMFGCKVTELTRNFQDLGDVLPPHSECYEEITLDMLIDAPKTYEELRGIIPEKSVARVLSRLQKAGLTETSKDKDYIFFFATKRSPSTSNLSPTEKRVYDSIPLEGISARKLSEKAGISTRRTYKYLRKLKGKKLVFTRKRPTSHALTIRGTQITLMLEAIRRLALEALVATSQFVKDDETTMRVPLDTNLANKRKKDIEIIPLTTLQPIKRD